MKLKHALPTETSPPTGGEQITSTPTQPIPGITGRAIGIAGITGAFIGTPYRALGSALILGILLFVAKKKK